MSGNRKDSDQKEIPATTGEAFAARRRVVKGVASAVPVIMTISSAHAQVIANASSLQCVQPPPPPEPEPSIKFQQKNIAEDLGNDYYVDTDGWVRKLVVPTTGPRELQLIYVDQDGEPGGEAYPVTKSCYASFLNT